MPGMRPVHSLDGVLAAFSGFSKRPKVERASSSCLRQRWVGTVATEGVFSTAPGRSEGRAGWIPPQAGVKGRQDGLQTRHVQLQVMCAVPWSHS